MALVTVVAFLLFSVTGIIAGQSGIHRASQVHNITRLEKRSTTSNVVGMKPAPFSGCDKTYYREVNSLYNFVYFYYCRPAEWKDFFDRKEVEQQISEISLQLYKLLTDQTYFIEPPMPDMFNAFKGLPLDQVKVVILGQDPTPQEGKATGMAFSLKQGVDPSEVPSVLNVLLELNLEGISTSLYNGDLTSWKKQGVLLLNTALTIRQKQKGKEGEKDKDKGSHLKVWKGFTALLIDYISKESKEGIAWFLWGEKAKAYAGLIKNPKNGFHYIKMGGHPSPKGLKGFFGGNYFHCANQFLKNNNRGEVKWSLGNFIMQQC